VRYIRRLNRAVNRLNAAGVKAKPRGVHMDTIHHLRRSLIYANPYLCPHAFQKWRAVKPEYRTNNPKIDFYGWDGAYLYSSNYYRNTLHALAHLERNQCTGYSIVRNVEISR
jgi:hypothetical protein